MKRVILSALVAAIGTISFQADAQDRTFTDPDGFRAVETSGGYQPANPPLPANTPADAKIVTVSSISPASAYPPPAPAASYPPCSAQRRDACIQRK